MCGRVCREHDSAWSSVYTTFAGCSKTDAFSDGARMEVVSYAVNDSDLIDVVIASDYIVRNPKPSVGFGPNPSNRSATPPYQKPRLNIQTTDGGGGLRGDLVFNYREHLWALISVWMDSFWWNSTEMVYTEIPMPIRIGSWRGHAKL